MLRKLLRFLLSKKEGIRDIVSWQLGQRQLRYKRKC